MIIQYLFFSIVILLINLLLEQVIRNNRTQIKLLFITLSNANNHCIDGVSEIILCVSKDDISFVERYKNSLKKFVLSQKSSNPFNSSTKISWQTKYSRFKTLVVNDVSDNEVVRLVDEYTDVVSHEIEFNLMSMHDHIANRISNYKVKGFS